MCTCIHTTLKYISLRLSSQVLKINETKEYQANFNVNIISINLASQLKSKGNVKLKEDVFWAYFWFSYKMSCRRLNKNLNQICKTTKLGNNNFFSFFLASFRFAFCFLKQCRDFPELDRNLFTTIIKCELFMLFAAV